MLNSSTLSGFYGTETYTRKNMFGRTMMLTDGARYIADNGGKGENSGAWWLTDIFQTLPPEIWNRQDFIVGKLIPNKTTSGAVFVAEDGNGNELYKQRIPYTDFDFANAGASFEKPFQMWCVRGEYMTLMLPTEY